MDNSLIHWGILGMKWGVRRKGRSSSNDSPDHISTKSLKRKRLSEMSNEELQRLTTRMQLEKQYKDLRSSDVAGAKKFVDGVLTDVGKKIATKWVATAVEKGLPKLITVVKNAVSNNG